MNVKAAAPVAPASPNNRRPTGTDPHSQPGNTAPPTPAASTATAGRRGSQRANRSGETNTAISPLTTTPSARNGIAWTKTPQNTVPAVENAALPETALRSIVADMAHASRMPTSSSIDPTRIRRTKLSAATKPLCQRAGTDPNLRRVGIPRGPRSPAASASAVRRRIRHRPVWSGRPPRRPFSWPPCRRTPDFRRPDPRPPGAPPRAPVRVDLDIHVHVLVAVPTLLRAPAPSRPRRLPRRRGGRQRGGVRLRRLLFGAGAGAGTHPRAGSDTGRPYHIRGEKCRPSRGRGRRWRWRTRRGGGAGRRGRGRLRRHRGRGRYGDGRCGRGDWQ